MCPQAEYVGLNVNYVKLNVNFRKILTTTETTEDKLRSASGLVLWEQQLSAIGQQLSKKIFSVNFASSSLFKIFILKKSIQNRTYIRPSIIDFIQSSSFSNNMIDCLTNDLMHPSL